MIGSAKVICWNSSGIKADSSRTPEKLAFLDSQYPNANFAILALVETHHRNEGDIPEELKEYKTSHHLIHTPTHAESYGGLIVFITKDFEILSKKVVIPGRLLNITICREKENKLNLSVFYGPQWCKLTKSDAKQVIDHFSTIHSVDENNIIIGDFNFVEQNLDKGKGMSSNDKILHQLFEDFKANQIIVDAFRHQYPKKRQYSFITQHGKSRGDRIYVSEDIVNMISNIKYTITPFGTAHKVMTFSINNDLDIGPGYYKMNSSVVNEPLYRKEVEKIFAEINDLQLQSSIDWWDLFVMVVRTITIKY